MQMKQLLPQVVKLVVNYLLDNEMPDEPNFILDVRTLKNKKILQENVH